MALFTRRGLPLPPLTYDTHRPIDAIDVTVIIIDLIAITAIPYAQKYVYPTVKFPFPTTMSALQMLISAPILVPVIFAHHALARRTSPDTKLSPPFSAPRPGAHLGWRALLLLAGCLLFAANLVLDNYSTKTMDQYIRSSLRLTAAIWFIVFGVIINRVTESPWIGVSCTAIAVSAVWFLADAYLNESAHKAVLWQDVVTQLAGALCAGGYFAATREGCKWLRDRKNTHLSPFEVTFYIQLIGGAFLLLIALGVDGTDALNRLGNSVGGEPEQKWGKVVSLALITLVFKSCGTILLMRNPAATTAIVLALKTTTQIIIELSIAKLWTGLLALPVIIALLGSAHYVWLRLDCPGLATCCPTVAAARQQRRAAAAQNAQVAELIDADQEEEGKEEGNEK